MNDRLTSSTIMEYILHSQCTTPFFRRFLDESLSEYSEYELNDFLSLFTVDGCDNVFIFVDSPNGKCWGVGEIVGIYPTEEGFDENGLGLN